MNRTGILQALADGPLHLIEGATSANGFTTRWGRKDCPAFSGSDILTAISGGVAICNGSSVEITEAGRAAHELAMRTSLETVVLEVG